MSEETFNSCAVYLSTVVIIKVGNLVWVRSKTWMMGTRMSLRMLVTKTCSKEWFPRQKQNVEINTADQVVF
jgi:hypothetical protein